VIVGGDFNADVNRAKELSRLNEYLKNSFDVVGVPLGRARSTQYFFARDGFRIDQQIDAIYTDARTASDGSIRSARPVDNFNGDGTIQTQGTNYDDRALKNSDHRPVSVVLQVKEWVSDWMTKAR
jgi:hypothetical protein